MKIGQPPDTGAAVASASAGATAKSPPGGGAVASAAAAKPAASARPASASAASAAPSEGVSVTMSDAAKSMEKTSDAGDIDHKKVAEMKQAIKDGSFKANPEAIADKMLSNAQEMMDRSGKPLN